MTNLERHVENVRVHYGLPCVVAVNRFASDTTAEFRLIQKRLAPLDVSVVSASHWADGSAGAEELARVVVSLAEASSETPRFVYEDELSLWDKVKAVATKIYHAADVVANDAVLAQVAELQAGGYGHYPVCIAKTQYSFSTDPNLRGAPSGHMLNVREVRLAAGAEFVVFICGDLMTMPGLPRVPAAHRIDVDESGMIVGLS
jgi:formate--tetrahydrofolate ligase